MTRASHSRPQTRKRQRLDGAPIVNAEASPMKEQLADHAKDWLTLALAGLGISFATHNWLGGMFLALAGAAFAMRMDPEQDQRELWVVMLGAFITSHVAAIAVHFFWPAFPVQLVMLAAGFFSRRLTRMAFGFFTRVEKRTDAISDRVIDRIIPEKEDGA